MPNESCQTSGRKRPLGIKSTATQCFAGVPHRVAQMLGRFDQCSKTQQAIDLMRENPGMTAYAAAAHVGVSEQATYGAMK